MSQVTVDDVRNYVENNIGSFHAARLRKLEELKLDQMLKRKNPYLFRAKNLLHASDLIKTFLDAHLSSQEETIFGQFLEGLVIFVNADLYTEIIEPLGHRAKERNEEFSENYNRVMNKFSESFMKRFCEDGRIQWQKLLHFNSGYEPPSSD